MVNCSILHGKGLRYQGSVQEFQKQIRLLPAGCMVPSEDANIRHLILPQKELPVAKSL